MLRSIHTRIIVAASVGKGSLRSTALTEAQKTLASLRPVDPPGDWYIGMANSNPISLMSVDENGLQAAGMRPYFEPEDDIEVAGVFPDAAEAASAAACLKPSVALLSLSLPDMTPFDVCRQIGAVAPDTRIITLGPSPVREADVDMSLMVGSCSHLPVGASRSDFVRVVRATGVGEALEIAEVADIHIRIMSSFPGPVDLATLTSRERRILVMVSKGLNNTEIADALEISAHTVRRHVSQILHKLNRSSRAELGIYASMVSILDDIEEG